MKPLYFTACSHPRVAPALAAQAHESLRPYTAYLKSALTAAVKREARSNCRWEPVPREYPVRLVPMDTLLVLESDGVAYRIEDWSGDVPEMPLFVGAQYRPVVPKSVQPGGGGLTVLLDEAVDEDDQVFWAGRACTLLPAEPSWPRKIQPRRRDGAVARLFQRRDASTRVVLVVEGRDPLVLLDERGTELRHRVADPHEGATRLRIGGAEIPWTGQISLSLPAPPDEDILISDNGVRWSWSDDDGRGRRRRGVWIQLLASEDGDSEAAMDIRAAYCEEGVREVRTKKGKNPKHSFRVWGSKRDNYQLELDRLPPEGSSLFIPSSISGLRRQRQALYRIKDSPLTHHRALLMLCEAPDKVRWPRCQPRPVDRWYMLDDDRWSGTLQQRGFVEKALGTRDFAFLEGPPGSGKTHAICELVLQFIDQGLNVLLCSTTHVAVDNVVERLVGRFEQVEAVRIGLADRVDQSVRDVQIDERISTLVERWRAEGVFSDLDDEAIERVAEATLLSSVNLTCGTSTGILAHPYIRRSDDGRDDDTGPRWPYFDVLIIDEASKTTFQEFLVPAQLARRWIVVGDVRQLPPFSEPKDLEASIAEVSDENDAALSDAHQAALLILFRLQRPEAGVGRVRWLIEEPDDALAALATELKARAMRGDRGPEFCRVVTRGPSEDEVVSIADVECGAPAALRLLAADWILFPPELRDRLEGFLPSDGLTLRDWSSDSMYSYRHARWFARRGTFKNPIREQRRRFHTTQELAARQRTFLIEESWAKQVAWRLGRVHQLSSAQNDQQRERRQGEVDMLMPAAAPLAAWVPPAIDAIRDVGVRSVIESFRVRRVDHRVRRLSALTEAIPSDVWDERAVLLEYQHRMHPDISALPRDQFYEGAALKDANTLDGRDDVVGWSFAADAPSRRVWVDVRGREDRGINHAEIEAMRRWLERWREYAKGHRRTDGKDWEVACLSFYNRQELGTRDMLRRLTGMPRAETRFALPNTSLICATVDRFQGREADLVLLSLRNTSRPGHMDSPNRLNVGITRARFFLVVFGHRKYFSEDCPSEELNALADASPVFEMGVPDAG
ncbi:MAG: AAA family ATPase [Myxococcales bacterium]|nr:AAA family ATPase [Myxococcales bacterium]